MFIDPHFPPGGEPGGVPACPSALKRAQRREAQRRARQARFAKLIDQFEADEIEAAVEGLIALLDLRDGDVDLEDGGDTEPNGDERDASFPEGGHLRFFTGWLGGTVEVPIKFDRAMRPALAIEDAEDDDPAGGNITDEPHDSDGDEADGNGSEDDFMFHGGNGPGCPLSDPGGTLLPFYE